MTRPDGVYADIPEALYHADRDSLSVSGAKMLLPPSCPALFKHQRDNGRPPRSTFDFGHAAHAEVLGVGADVVVVDADDWRGKAARDERDAARAAGKTPVLAAEWRQVIGMADALRAHPLAAELLDPAHGQPEVSAYWTDPKYGVRRRCRYDFLPHTDGGRLVIPDYKTAKSADPWTFARSAAAYGYHMQDAWYTDTARALGLADDVEFVFVVQEKEAPYLVSVVQLDDLSVDQGRRNNDTALRTYRECTDTGVWPGYTDGVELISLPAWALFDDDNEMVV